MAGSIDLVQRCFTGLKTGAIVWSWIRTGRNHLVPLASPSTTAATIHVRVRGREAEVSVDQREVAPVVIECRGRVEELARGRTIRFPYHPADAPGSTVE